jgi:hypothetical protein
MIYKAVTLDGQEHAGLDQWTLKQWYFARRLRPESLVLCPATGEWKLLKNLFDPAQWEAEERKIRGLGPNDSVYKQATLPQQLRRVPEAKSQSPYVYDRTNESGLRAAGVLMFITAALTLASLLLIFLKPTSPSQVSSAWGFSVLLDVIIAVKLLTSDNATRWQRIALVRVGFGGLLGLLVMLVGLDQLTRLLGLFEIVYASSFFVLLVGRASTVRVVAGVMAFVISICSIVGVLVLIGLSGLSDEAMAKHQIFKYALPDRAFIDGRSGARVDLPDGWVMLPSDNPILRHSDAEMIFAHPDSGSFATLVIARNGEWPNLDAALSVAVTTQRTRELSTVEVGRFDSTMFRRLDGRKAELTWQDKGKEFKGSVSVARNGQYYIFLNEWCAAGTYSTSRPQFDALEADATAGEPMPDAPNPFATIRIQPLPK